MNRYLLSKQLEEQLWNPLREQLNNDLTHLEHDLIRQLFTQFFDLFWWQLREPLRKLENSI